MDDFETIMPSTAGQEAIAFNLSSTTAAEDSPEIAPKRPIEQVSNGAKTHMQPDYTEYSPKKIKLGVYHSKSRVVAKTPFIIKSIDNSRSPGKNNCVSESLAPLNAIHGIAVGFQTPCDSQEVASQHCITYLSQFVQTIHDDKGNATQADSIENILLVKQKSRDVPDKAIQTELSANSSDFKRRVASQEQEVQTYMSENIAGITTSTNLQEVKYEEKDIDVVHSKLLDTGFQSREPLVFGYIEMLRAKVQALQNQILKAAHESRHAATKDTMQSEVEVSRVNVSDTRIAEGLKCGICLNILSNPHSTACGHTYCFACIREVAMQVEEEDLIKCPECRAHLTAHPYPNRSMFHQIYISNLKDSLEKIELKLRIEKGVSESKKHEKPWEACWPETVPIIDDEDDNVRRCGRCGWEILDGACVHCATRFEGSVSDNSLNSSEAGIRRHSCIHCGSEIDAGFCSNCNRRMPSRDGQMHSSEEEGELSGDFIVNTSDSEVEVKPRNRKGVMLSDSDNEDQQANDWQQSDDFPAIISSSDSEEESHGIPKRPKPHFNRSYRSTARNGKRLAQQSKKRNYLIESEAEDISSDENSGENVPDADGYSEGAEVFSSDEDNIGNTGPKSKILHVVDDFVMEFSDEGQHATVSEGSSAVNEKVDSVSSAQKSCAGTIDDMLSDDNDSGGADSDSSSEQVRLTDFLNTP